MGRVKEFVIGCMDRAGWPLESMELVCVIAEQVGHDDLEGELVQRASTACDGWQLCLREYGDERSELCHICPLGKSE